MKAHFVYEKFSEESDPIQDMGIGIKPLIENWLKKYDIKHYKINDDLTITVHGDLYLNEKMESLPYYINFYKVFGNVDLVGLGLTTLKGCPQYISGYFSCHENLLTSLEGGPKKVLTSHVNNINKHWGYKCTGNKLTSLKGLAKIIYGSIWIFKNARVFAKEEIIKKSKIYGDIVVKE